DIEAMNKAAKHFVGEQDFTAVCRSDESVANNIREVTESHFAATRHPEVSIRFTNNNLICYQITASAFCWQMVRSIVGVLVEVGKGKIDESEIPPILSSKQRSYGGQLAPAQG